MICVRNLCTYDSNLHLTPIPSCLVLPRPVPSQALREIVSGLAQRVADAMDNMLYDDAAEGLKQMDRLVCIDNIVVERLLDESKRQVRALWGSAPSLNCTAIHHDYCCRCRSRPSGRHQYQRDCPHCHCWH